MKTNNDCPVVFAACNNHSPDCGKPSKLSNENPGRCYYGYFENAYGEQLVFVYDNDPKRGMVRGGDFGWDNAHEVTDGAVDLFLNEPEALWLRACWTAAMLRFET